jgi:hypothetical protein
MKKFKRKKDIDLIKKMILPIKIISPVGDNWKEGSTHKIKWEKKNVGSMGVDIYLVNHNGKKNIKIIKKGVRNMNVPSFSGSKNHPYYAYIWNIPKNVLSGLLDYTGYYRIKIVRVDGKAKGLSRKFHLLKQVKTYTLHPVVINKAKRYYHYKNFIGSSNSRGMGFPKDPASGILRVGWSNTWEQWGVGNIYHWQLNFFFRSFISFDFKEFKNNIFIIKVILHLNKDHTYYASSNGSVNNNDAGVCMRNLYIIDDEVWLNHPFDIKSLRKVGGQADTYDITQYVNDWIRKGNNNGFALTSRVETPRKNNEECITYYTAYLELTVYDTK